MFGVQQAELVESFGSIHPFPSKEVFFSPSPVSLGFFHAFFFYPFFHSIFTLGEGGAAFPAPLPCPAPRSMPSCLRGLGSDPSALGLLRRAVRVGGDL